MGASSHRKRFSRRKRSVVGLLALVATALFLLPASQAAAVTYNNACVNNIEPTKAALIPVTMTATATPNPVAGGGSVTLSSIHQELAVPSSVFLAGYNLGLLTTGVNEIPTEVLTRIVGTNTVEGEQIAEATGVAVTTITDPTPTEPGSGDESATPGLVSVTYPSETWTANSSGTINFREKTVEPLKNNEAGVQTVSKVAGGVITARFGCDPGHVVDEANPSTITFETGATFASTEIEKATFPVNLSTTEEGEGTVACEVNGSPQPCTGTYTSFDTVKVVATPASKEFNVGTITATGSAAGHCSAATGVCEFEIAEDSSVAVAFVPASTRAEVEGNVHGEVPQTTTLESLCSDVDMGKFVPGAAGVGEVPPVVEGHSYEGSCAVIVTSTGEATSLTAADLSGIDTGFLTQKPLHPYSLAKPLFVGAKELAPLGGEATLGGALVSPVTLMTWATPVSKGPVGVGFRQPIGEHDPLHTGVYAKTITLTLQQTTP